SDDYRIAPRGALITADAFEVTKESQFFKIRMDNPDALLIARKVSPATGVHQKRPAEGFRLALFVTRLDRHVTVLIRKLCYGPAFADFRSRSPRMLEQQMVEGGAF